MNNTSINNLLDIINHIKGKYDEISRITGRNFNMFEILGLTKNEVRLHSNFIAYLLNPNASHGQGTIYLDLFLKMISNKIKLTQTKNDTIEIKLDSKSTRVSVEYYIGKKTDEEGGRIDIICIDRNNNMIIIENKIHAPDQKNQISRYNNYNKNAILIYLDLFGNNPTKDSLGDKEISELNLIILSYENDIIQWLELCLKESYQLPLIRESVFQYLSTIKKLTNQIEIKEMDNDIVNILTSNKEKITSAILIEKALNDAKKVLIKKFGEELYTKLKIKYKKFAVVEKDECFGERHQGIYVYSDSNDQISFQISFLNDYKEFYLEVCNMNNIENGVLKSKDQDNVSYYENNLNKICNSLGKIPNVRKSWKGDWVCYYTKLDSFFLEENGFGEIADKNYEIVDVVIKEISPIIDCMLVRISSPKNNKN